MFSDDMLTARRLSEFDTSVNLPCRALAIILLLGSFLLQDMF